MADTNASLRFSCDYAISISETKFSAETYEGVHREVVLRNGAWEGPGFMRDRPGSQWRTGSRWGRMSCYSDVA